MKFVQSSQNEGVECNELNKKNVDVDVVDLNELNLSSKDFNFLQPFTLRTGTSIPQLESPSISISLPVRLINAENDAAATATWLANFQGHTRSNYQREAERFLLWLTYFFSAPKKFKDLKLEDIQAYKAFCQNPQPAEFWCMAAKHPRHHPNWRPFYQPLSIKSIALAFNILNGLFNWLQRANYLSQNPFSLMPKLNTHTGLGMLQERYIPEQLWDAVETQLSENQTRAELLFKENPTPQNQQILAEALRQEWLIQLLYQTGMRISEAIKNTMDCFELEYNINSLVNTANTNHQYICWLKIIGKGDKIRKIPISDSLLQKLAHYRYFVLGLPPLPAKLIRLTDINTNYLTLNLELGLTINSQADEVSAISLVSQIKAQKINTPHRSALHNEIKVIFKNIQQQIAARTDFAAVWPILHILSEVSAHWLRHSIWTHMANHDVDLRVIRDNAGHASIATTNIYLHTEEQKRHAASVGFKK